MEELDISRGGLDVATKILSYWEDEGTSVYVEITSREKNYLRGVITAKINKFNRSIYRINDEYFLLKYRTSFSIETHGVIAIRIGHTREMKIITNEFSVSLTGIPYSHIL